MLQLDIFVSAQCFGCAEARRLAGAVRRRFATVDVRVIDLDACPDRKPEQVIAVPAYLLDEHVIALGNPREGDLYQRIETVLAARGTRP